MFRVSRHARTAARSDEPRGERGITLVEVVIALAVLGIIMGPLAMAFITGMRSTRSAESVLGESRSAQQIASLWTRDVQNVEPDGVNSQEPCPSSDDAGLPEEHLVTFSWGTSTSAGNPQSATWVIVGSGSNAIMERRACEAGQPTVTQTVADSFGLTGEEASTVVRGPAPSDPRQFCPHDTDNVGRTCTIVVDGRYNYHLSVERRVHDTRLAQLPPTPPGPPVIDLAEPRREMINVAWTPPALAPTQPEILGYRVHLYTDPDGEPILSEDVVDTTHSLTGLTNGTEYWIRVQAQNSVGWGPMSVRVGPVVPTNTSPEAPSIVSVAPLDTAASVTFTPNPNDGGSAVIGWHIYAELDDGTEVTDTLIVHTGGATESGVLPGLINGQSYRLSVAGINAFGEGPRSVRSELVTPFGIPGEATIIGLESLPDGSIVLDWNEPTTLPPDSMSIDGGRPITGYRIRAVTGSPSGPWPASGLLGESVRTHTITGLTLGETYSFVVETHNERGFSTSQPSADGVSATPPGQPRDLVASQAGTGQVTFTWNPPASDGGSPITGYQVTRTGLGTPVSLGPTASSHTFTGLASGTTYTFSVRAVNAVGQGAYANTNQTALGTPSAVSPGVSRQPGNTYPFAVNVNWSPPSNRGGGCITSYRVEYSTNGSTVNSSQTLTGSPGPAPACSGEPGTSAAWTGLPAGVQTRYFRVVATNTGGDTSTSGWASIQMTQECTVPVLEDVYSNDNNPVFGTDERGRNHGGAGHMEVHRNRKNLFVKFNPRADNGSNCSQFGQRLPASAVANSGAVEIYLYDTSNFCRDHRVHRVTGNWSEGGLTHNNQPGYDQGGGQLCSNGSARWMAFSVSTAQINQQRTGDRYGWTVRDVGGNILSSHANYRSREGNASQAARLVIQFY